MSKQSRLIIAGAFFTVWLGILYSGADHPPPLGFLWVVLFCLIAAGVVYVRVPAYAGWSATRRRFRLWHVVLDGAVAGLAFALVALLLNGSGEPTVQATWIDYVIWSVVLAVMGIANAMFIYFVGFIFIRFAKNGR